MNRILAISVLVISLFLSGCASTWTSDTKVAAKTKRSKRAQRAQVVNINGQSIGNITDDSNDLWNRVRDGFEIPDPDEPLIIKHTQQLSSNPEYVKRLMLRSATYLFYIVEEVEARDMPSELALLPFVESAFNPKAVSPAKASGMWQFMPATGRSYNLKQNTFRDERLDIIHSTRAALDYLGRLYQMFGDWQLALAAYNWGEGSVARAIARNKAAGLPTDYFSLKMPNETRNYVPKLLAYKRVVENPMSYGFVLPPVENHPYFVAVKLDKDIDLDLVIQLSEISRDQFLSLNPSFNKPLILSAANPSILLPFGKAEIFQDNLRKYQKPLSTLTAVLIDRTETVDKVAANLNVDAAYLRQLNNIPAGMKIRAGSTVVIPKTNDKDGDVPVHLADNGLLNLEKEFTPVGLKCRGKNCHGQGPTPAASRNHHAVLPTGNGKKTVGTSSKSTNKPKTEGKSAGKTPSTQVKKTTSQKH